MNNPIPAPLDRTELDSGALMRLVLSDLVDHVAFDIHDLETETPRTERGKLINGQLIEARYQAIEFLNGKIASLPSVPHRESTPETKDAMHDLIAAMRSEVVA